MTVGTATLMATGAPSKWILPQTSTRFPPSTTDHANMDLRYTDSNNNRFFTLAPTRQGHGLGSNGPPRNATNINRHNIHGGNPGASLAPPWASDIAPPTGQRHPCAVNVASEKTWEAVVPAPTAVATSVGGGRTCSSSYGAGVRLSPDIVAVEDGREREAGEKGVGRVRSAGMETRGFPLAARRIRKHVERFVEGNGGTKADGRHLVHVLQVRT